MVLHYEDPSLVYLSQGLGNLLSPLTQVLQQNQQQRRDNRISQQLASQINPDENGISLLTKILNTPEALDLVNRNSNVFQRALAAAAPQQPNPLTQMLYEKILNPDSEENEGIDLTQAAILSGDPSLQAWAKIENQNKQDYQKRSFDVNKPLYEEMEGVRKVLDNQKIALQRIEDAIQTGQTSRFWNSFMKKFGLDMFRTAPTQILEAANKEFFMGDLKQLAGGRINQFLEKNLLNALPKVEYSPTANQEIVNTLKVIQELKEKKLELFDNLNNKYAEKGKELPRNAAHIIQKQLEAFADKRIKDLKDMRQSSQESTENKVRVRSPSGEIFYMTRREAARAAHNGGKILRE